MSPRATELPLQLEPAVSRTDRVAEALKKAILDGRFPPGAPMVERELAEMLGVSKTPVRDALRQLLASGLVELSSYQGVVVRRIDVPTIRELYQARATIEPEAVAHAALLHPGASPEAAAALKAGQEGIAAGSMNQVSMANRAFHRHLYARCGNRFFVDFLDELQDLTALVAVSGSSPEMFRAEAADHEEILRAVESGDLDRTKILITRHVIRASQQRIQALTAEGVRDES